MTNYCYECRYSTLRPASSTPASRQELWNQRRMRCTKPMGQRHPRSLNRSVADALYVYNPHALEEVCTDFSPARDLRPAAERKKIRDWMRTHGLEEATETDPAWSGGDEQPDSQQAAEAAEEQTEQKLKAEKKRLDALKDLDYKS